MTFTPGALLPLDRTRELAIAFVPNCPDCEPSLAAMWPSYPYTDSRQVQKFGLAPYLSLAYYLEWDGKNKVERACFGIVFEEVEADGRVCLRRRALFKRAVGKKDWDRFGHKYFGQTAGTLDEHYWNVHFDVKELARMLAGYLPAPASHWSYWD